MKFASLLALLFLCKSLLFAQERGELKPFVIDHRKTEGTTIDLSWLNEKPAGKNGFIVAKKGHFYDAKGQRIKFWGVNITDWTRGSVQIPTKEESVFWAKTLARFGVNVVRLTFLDFTGPRGLIDRNRNDSRRLDSLQLDKFDFWVSELKRNGIYSDINLLVGRTFKAGDSVPEYQGVHWAKFSAYFDPAIIKLQK